MIKRELNHLIISILKKTADLKVKVREASINICIYLSHQPSIGPEMLTTIVIEEIEKINNGGSKDAAGNLGNSTMWVSLLQLLN
jgi:hypothetical protein